MLATKQCRSSPPLALFSPHPRPVQYRRRTRIAVFSSSNHLVSQQAASITRRQLGGTTAATVSLSLLLLLGNPSSAHALGFKKELKRRKIALEEYNTLPNGLKFYDVTTGTGKEVSEGAQVTVHFDCLFRGIDVVSSRAARLLGGNRTIAEPFQFIAGQPVSASTVKVSESGGGGGLFSGMGGPKPPPALSSSLVGMRVGGVRSVMVTPELGYGDKGEQEIGPGESFEMKIEVLDVGV